MVCWTPCPVRTSIYFLANFGFLNGCISFNIGPQKTIKLRIFVNLRFPLQSYVGLVFFVQIQGLLSSPPRFEIRKWFDGQLETTAPLFQEKAMITKIQLLTFDFRPFGPIITSKISSQEAGPRMLQKLTVMYVDISNKHKKISAVQQETGVTKTARFSVSKLFRSFQVKLVLR